MSDYEIFTLPNGIRVVHKQVMHTKVAHCGFILDIGSRDEKPDQQGIAHFWEHMAFKGTKKRRAFHILNRLDAVGGELNAYTTKEKICFYASVLDVYYENAIELLYDITFESIFPEKQIERERSVILEEMAMYYDTPEDAIQDDFDDLVFSGHPLGRNILGTSESIRSFKRADFKEFISENLDTERLIFSSVGPASPKKVRKLAEKYFSQIPTLCRTSARTPFFDYQPKRESSFRSLTQSQCAIGRPAYPIKDDNRLLFFALVNILGGPGMNSRLNLVLREKYGYVYAVEASYTPYIDTGIFGIYFGTEPAQLDKGISVVLKELKKLREVPLGTNQLHNAKEQLIGQLAMAEENNINLMLMMGKSLLDLGKIDPLESIFKDIKNIAAIALQDIANEVFVEDTLSILKFVPKLEN